MSYEELKKLDKVSLKKLRDGQGPCDECICHILSLPPDPLTFGKVYRKIRCYIRRFMNPPPPPSYDPKGSKHKGKRKPSPKSSRTSAKSKKAQAKGSFDSSSNMKKPSKNKGVEVDRKKKGGCCRKCC